MDAKLAIAIGSSIDYGDNVAVQSDGKMIVAGPNYNGSNCDFVLLRYVAGSNSAMLLSDDDQNESVKAADVVWPKTRDTAACRRNQGQMAKTTTQIITVCGAQISRSRRRRLKRETLQVRE